MKRIETSLVLFMVAVCCYSADAATSFRWFNATGCAATTSGGGSLPLNSTVLTYTTSSGAPTTWDNNWTSSTDGGLYGADGTTEVMIYAAPSAVAGFYWTAFYSGPGEGQRVYAVVLDLPYATYQSIGVPDGTEYDITSVSYGPLPLAPPGASLSINGETLQTGNPGTQVIHVVPEPTTLALLATGIGVMMMRRRKNQAGETEQSA